MANHNLPDDDLKFPLQPFSQIGTLLVEFGKITRSELDRIIQYQTEHHLKFGEAAIKLGFVTAEDINEALSQQFDFPTFNTDFSGFSRDLMVVE